MAASLMHTLLAVVALPSGAMAAYLTVAGNPQATRGRPIMQAADEEDNYGSVDPAAAVNAMQEVAQRKIVRGSWKGDSTAIIAAAKVRDAAAAAAQDSGGLAEQLDDAQVKALADCLSKAEDGNAVETCMAEYCQSDEECVVDYSGAACEGEVDEPEVMSIPRRKRSERPPLRNWLLGGRATLVDSEGEVARSSTRRLAAPPEPGSTGGLRRRLFGRFF